MTEQDTPPGTPKNLEIAIMNALGKNFKIPAAEKFSMALSRRLDEILLVRTTAFPDSITVKQLISYLKTLKRITYKLKQQQNNSPFVVIF